MKTGFRVVKTKQNPEYFICFGIRLGEKCRRPYMRYNCGKAEENIRLIKYIIFKHLKVSYEIFNNISNISYIINIKQCEP